MKYAIYQIKKESSRELGFLSLNNFREITKQEDTIAMTGAYNLIYAGETPKSSTEDIEHILEGLYTKFNINHPEDFRGHSMSMGDIVKVGNKYYYCDSVGFIQIQVRKVPKVEVAR